MAIGTELERLVVRLVGDGNSYDRMIKKASGNTEKAADKINKEIKGFEKSQKKALAEAARITNSVLTPTEKYSKELKKLDSFLKSGYISQTTYNRALKAAQMEVSGVDKKFSFLNSTLGKLAITTFGFLSVRKAISTFKELADTGSDLFESTNKAQVVLGSAFSDVQKYAEGAARLIGQSEREAIDAASTFAIFGKSAGLSGKELGDFSIQFTKLASDFASFYNTSPQEAIVAIGAAFRGENEPIRRYGILLDDASMRQEAFEAGIISTTKHALTPQQKVLAASRLIMEQSADAQDDFSRTSEGMANRQRILAAEIENTKAAIGRELIPIMQDFYTLALKIASNDKLVSFFRNLAKGISIELDVLSGKSLDFIRVERGISEALEKGGSEGMDRLVSQVESLKTKWKEQNKITEEWKKKLDQINRASGNANVDWFVKKFEKERDSLNALEEQIGLTQIALDKLISPSKPSGTGAGGDDKKTGLDAMSESQLDSYVKSLESEIKAIENSAGYIDSIEKTLTQSLSDEYNDRVADSIDFASRMTANEYYSEDNMKKRTDVYNKAQKEILDTQKKSELVYKQLVDDANIAELNNIQNDTERELALHEYKFEKLKKLYTKGTKELTEIERLEAAERAKIEQMRMQSAIDDTNAMFSSLLTAAENFGHDQTVLYRVLFAAAQAFRVAEATANMFQAISNAGAAGKSPAETFANMAAVGAQMAAVLASVSAVGMAHDGINSIPETGSWILKKGERVTTAETSAKLDRTLDDIRNGTSGMNVNIYEAPGTSAQVTQRRDGGIDVEISLIEEKLTERMHRGTGMSKYLDRRYRRQY